MATHPLRLLLWLRALLNDSDNLFLLWQYLILQKRPVDDQACDDKPAFHNDKIFLSWTDQANSEELFAIENTFSTTILGIVTSLSLMLADYNNNYCSYKPLFWDNAM